MYLTPQIMYLSLVLIVQISARLIDYSRSDYIPVIDGYITIWKDYNYIKHTTDLSTYIQITKETKEFAGRFTQPHMRKILDADITHLETLLETLNIHHRHARSINLLGTALKVIVGTPDFDDLENLKFRQQELIDSENRQIEINTKAQEQINKLTEAVNTLIGSSKQTQTDTGNLYETLIARNIIIASGLETLILSITLAKIQIVNPVMLDSKDLEKLINEHNTNTTIADLMQASNVKILLDDKYLHFIIKYPKPAIVCKKITLYPVQHNKTILHFAENNNVADCNHKIIAIKECRTASTSTFCKQAANTMCAQQLHSDSIAHCNTRPSHLNPVVEIDDGIVIMNDGTAIVRVGGALEKIIIGTYLITFNDELQVNGSTYKNLNGVPKKSSSSAAAALLNITNHQGILSLPYLRRLNVQNLHHIGEIQTHLITRPIISSVTTIIILVGCYILLQLYKNQKKKRTAQKLQDAIKALTRSEDVPHLEGEELTQFGSATATTP